MTSLLIERRKLTLRSNEALGETESRGTALGMVEMVEHRQSIGSIGVVNRASRNTCSSSTEVDHFWIGIAMLRSGNGSARVSLEFTGHGDGWLIAALRGVPAVQDTCVYNKMGPRQRIHLVAITVFIVLLSLFTASQAGTEYLTWSIDCGSDRNYTDQATGIPWVTDEAFIKTGKNARNVTIHLSNEAYVNKEQLRTLRYFDDSRQRHCYVLPVKNRTTYLLRATFFLGNLTDSTKRDISFIVRINATRWQSFAFDPEYDYNRTRSKEAIIYSQGAVLNICLTKSRTAVAFISTLELREFTTGMYSSAAAGGYQFQLLDNRINSGMTPTADNEPLSYLRYPDDPYDRLWWSYGSWDGLGRITNTRRSSLSSSLQMQNRPPAIVMDDAWTATDNQSFAFKSSGYRNYIGPMVTYCYVMEFDKNWTDIQYSVDNIVIDEFNATNVPRQIVSSITVPAHNYTMIFASVNTTSPPILNALETYILNNWNTSFTTIADVNAITNVKQAFNLVDWSGDPCLPSPYDWLNCTPFQDTSESDDERDIKYSPVIYKITGLSLVNGTARATDRNAVAEITNLTNVNTLNLSNNGISNSSINLSRLANLSILDVSNNNFSGEVVDFARSVGIFNVQELYMSGNNFSSFSSKPSSPLFRNLTKLDLSKNRIEGDVMDFMTSIGDHFITQLYAAYNFLEGQFRLISEFKNIEILDFDGQNINGTLDLSDWNSHTMVTQLIKLRNNSIEDVYPSLDKLSWIINNASIYAPIYYRGSSMDSNQGAILLSGNPWCQAIDNKTLAQRYLCRNNSTDFVDYNDVGVPRPKSHKISWAEILGISIGGGVLILFFKICFAILLRKLKKKSDELAEIQEALTKQKVYPPMYSYAELRSATKNFAQCNNLGQGAYGAVYMGKMTDGTQVAVKKLFQDHQVLDEFLNEAVLITGIKHRNLAQLKGCCIDQGQRILVYEYAENGNLAEALWGQFDSMKKTESMNWERRLNICMGIARGLSYLHEELQPRIIHRDIKPANILIDGNFNAKIADFGLARSFLEEQTQADFTHVAGTLGYLAPEYVTQGLLTEKADIFSCGVVLLEVVSGRKCIDQSLPSEKVSLVNWANTLRETGNVMDILDWSIQSSCNEEEALQVIDIAFSCLQTEPSQRPTMSQVVIMLQPRLQGNASSFSRPLPGFNSISATIR